MVSVLICKRVLFFIFNSLDKFSEAIQASNHPNKNKIDIKTSSLIARDDIFSDFSVELRTSFSFKITLVTEYFNTTFSAREQDYLMQNI